MRLRWIVLPSCLLCACAAPVEPGPDVSDGTTFDDVTAGGACELPASAEFGVVCCENVACTKICGAA